jgi:hypothetical protein
MTWRLLTWHGECTHLRQHFACRAASSAAEQRHSEASAGGVATVGARQRSSTLAHDAFQRSARHRSGILARCCHVRAARAACARRGGAHQRA